MLAHKQLYWVKRIELITSPVSDRFHDSSNVNANALCFMFYALCSMLYLVQCAKSLGYLRQCPNVWKSCESMSKNEKVCQNFRKYVKTWESVSKPEKVFRSIKSVSKRLSSVLRSFLIVWFHLRNTYQIAALKGCESFFLLLQGSEQEKPWHCN